MNRACLNDYLQDYQFKKKFEKAQVIKNYRDNAFYTKKSVMLREEKLRASYVQKLKSKEL